MALVPSNLEPKPGWRLPGPRNKQAGFEIVASTPEQFRSFAAAEAWSARMVQAWASSGPGRAAAGEPRYGIAFCGDGVLCAADGIDCLIDATGAVEHGAQVTMQAIAYGKHVVTMNAELDATVGPILKRHADKAGVILTGCDGDQPGVQMNLYRFVRSIGLTPLLCGNIKGLHDPYRNPTTQKGFAERWGQNVQMVREALGARLALEAPA